MSNAKTTPTINRVEMVELLSTRHDALRQFVGKLLVDCPGGEPISNYFEVRSQHLAAMRQDLLPLLVYEATSKQPYENAMPVTAAWALYLAAAHSLDELQDSESQLQIVGPLPLQVTSAVIALGAANMALAAQEVGCEKLSEMLAVIGEVTINGAIAQRDELLNGRVWTKQDYFYNIASKSASIIAAGMWLGAALTMEDEQSLTAVRELGLSLGMMMQIADDCLDLAEDLASGTYTLPVIEALAKQAHPDQAQLKQLLDRQPLSENEIDTVVAILNDMGVITACRRVARAYQVQAVAALAIFPDLVPVFADYVSVNA
jgi:geranylgeranyl pyrophosphate synthase